MRFWCHYNTTANENKKQLFALSHINMQILQKIRQKHSPEHLPYGNCLDICISPFIQLLSLLIFDALKNVCSVDDDKAMLLLFEISHPALLTDRCPVIMATLNCQRLVKRIEAWWRFYLSCLCSSCWPITDTVEANTLDNARHDQNRLMLYTFYIYVVKYVPYSSHACYQP